MPWTREQFVARFGSVYENSPWVAEESYEAAANASDASELARVFARRVDAAPHERKLELIRAHPDLAGKAAVAGELSSKSNEEQSAAGIDRCTPEEYAEFHSLNARYKEKFGFPFVMAVRNSNRQDILAAFGTRLGNDRDTEFATAIAEIHKIARMRLETMHGL